MTTWWKQSGHAGPVVGAAGAPVLCATCPCGCTLCEYVLERQMATPVSPATYIDCSTSPVLATLKYAINQCAVHYIDGVYSGGASPPVSLTTSYVDDDTTEAELLALVIDMKTVKYTYSHGNSVNYYGRSPDYVSTIAAAIADAKAGGMSTGLSGLGSRWFISGDPGGPYSAQANNGQLNVSFSLGTFAAKECSTYAQSIQSSLTVFDKQGQTIPDEDQYGIVANVSLAAGDGTYAIDFGPTTTFPPNEPTTNSSIGYYLTNYFTLIDWDFACV